MGEQELSGKSRSTPAERAVGIVLVGLAAFFIYTMRDLPFRSVVFPIALLVILAGLGLVVALRPTVAEAPKPFRGIVNVLGGVVIVAAYVFSIDVIGFLAATIAFILVVLVVSGYLRGHRWRYPLIVAIAVPIALFLSRILVGVLKLPMP